MLPIYKVRLTSAITGQVNALLSPPSDHIWQARPYREALAVKFPDALDLSANFSRHGPERAGQSATFQQIVAGLDYNPTGREASFRRIVIVDDTLRGGTTAAALLTHLHAHGLSQECEVVVACPLWLVAAKRPLSHDQVN